MTEKFKFPLLVQEDMTASQGKCKAPLLFKLLYSLIISTVFLNDIKYFIIKAINEIWQL